MKKERSGCCISKLFKWIFCIFVFLVVIAVFFGSNDKDLDYYISKFGLSAECKNVIVEYLPDVDNFSHMEQEGTHAYSIIMNNGVKYYLMLTKDNKPFSLQSSEEDYDSRTRYYDKVKD